MIELIGYVAALLLAACGAPLAVEAMWRGKSSMSETLGTILFVWMWFIGELMMITYVGAEIGHDPVLFLNYGLNIGITGIILYYIYFPRKSK